MIKGNREGWPNKKKQWGMSMGYGNDEVNDMIIMGDNREQQGKNEGWWRTIGYMIHIKNL